MRSSGILLHISSLPGPNGIGTMGKDAYMFIDFLKNAGQKYWQVLPIGPTSYGDSPYQTFSVFAGNPYFIDLDLLCEEKLLTKSKYKHLNKGKSNTVDFGFQYEHRFKVLEIAFNHFIQTAPSIEYLDFKTENSFWLNDYALFMAIKGFMPEGTWANWDEDYKKRDTIVLDSFKNEHHQKIEFWKFIQFKFFEQWGNLKRYANLNKVMIIGDMPIYVAYDSSDVWANPKYWQLDQNLNPTVVAGVPPDSYSITGQLWGNPIYNYDLMEQSGFSWWIKRIEKSFELFDVLRIDHFRGFESYFSIAANEKTAEHGAWVKGPGMKLFSAVKAALGDVFIIAEDLGFLTLDVYKLLEECGFPGMKILQFGFDAYSDCEYLPHNYPRNAVVYPGTHDNPTLKGWIKTLNTEDYHFFKEYIQIRYKKEAVQKVIKECLKSVCEIAIIPMQDYLELDDRSRFNIPSKLGGNWIWRMSPSAITPELTEKIRQWTHIYRR